MRLSRMVIVAAITSAAGPLAWAQSTAAGTYYRLTSTSTYQRECLPPCTCPSMQPVPIKGSFLLTSKPAITEIAAYDVTNVRWQVELGTEVLHLSGKGTYTVNTLMHTQRLVLDLVDDSGITQHFETGWAPVRAAFPAIEVTISTGATSCIRTTIRVAAVPARPATVYRLVRGSTWQQGCFGVCDCVLREAVPIKGAFQLTLKDSNPLNTIYSIDQVECYFTEQGVVHHITGSGTYTRGGEFALTQRMELDLQTDGGPVEHFDSGTVVGGGSFPAIDIEVSIGGKVCYDTVIGIKAKPMGDFDLNATVDQNDFGLFQACLTGPDQAIKDAACTAADLDGDGDVDQEDFGEFQRWITGPGATMDPAGAW